MTIFLQNLSLDEAAGLKKQAETVVVEMMAKTANINGSWNRHSVVIIEFLKINLKGLVISYWKSPEFGCSVSSSISQKYFETTIEI